MPSSRQPRPSTPTRVNLSNNPDIRTLNDFLGVPVAHNNDTRRRRSRDRAARSRRQHRRITGYHNVFDELSPPDYDVFGIPSLTEATALPPVYDCTVEAADVLEVIWERNSPFQPAQMSPWQSIHVSLQGTLLTMSNAKTHGLLTPAWKRGRPTGEAGRRIRGYTLQHAEVGLASDHKKVEMVPKSPIAQLLPESALKQLQESDPSQFDIVYNYIARLRVEGDQILLRFKDSEHRSNWIDKICAAIDIAPPLEVRSEPRNHTLPRRRRRQERQRIVIRTNAAGLGLAPANLIAEQERILREHYPQLLRHTQQPPQPQHEEPPASPREPDDPVEETPDADNTADPENDQEPVHYYAELAFTFIREPSADDNSPSSLNPNAQQTRGSGTRSNDSSPPSSPNPDLPTPIPRPLLPTRHITETKLLPRHPRDPVREARYRRRCMPMLVHNSRYAQNIMHKGKRKVIDWKAKKLISWPASPPSYHDALYSRSDVTNASDAAERDREQDREREREGLPPGAGHAVMRLRGFLRRHGSSGELDCEVAEEGGGGGGGGAEANVTGTAVTTTESSSSGDDKSLALKGRAGNSVTFGRKLRERFGGGRRVSAEATGRVSSSVGFSEEGV